MNPTLHFVVVKRDAQLSEKENKIFYPSKFYIVVFSMNNDEGIYEKGNKKINKTNDLTIYTC